MLRKIIPALCLLVLAGVFSCTDNSVTPRTKEVTTAPPPRTINVNAKLELPLASQTADVYVRVNTGSWTLVGSVPNTSCNNIGSFSANNGDVIEFMVLEGSNPTWTAEYRAFAGSKCPNLGTLYCGDGTFGTIYQVTLTSTMNEFSLRIEVDTFNGGTLLIC